MSRPSNISPVAEPAEGAAAPALGGVVRYSVADPAKKDATYADLEAVPEHLVAEIVDGELVTSPRPASRHALASSVLGGLLLNPFHRGKGGPGGWIILDEPELHARRNVIVPDLAGWRRERMPEVPDAAAFELPPDWVCEVLSPRTEQLDRKKKMPAYARIGVPFAWLINPTTELLEVFQRTQRGTWELLATHAGAELVEAPPFDAVPIELSALWQR